MSERRCVKNVPYGGRSVSFHQCTRLGIVVREGKWYCKQHDPVEVQAKDAIRQKKWEDEWAAKDKQWKLQSTAPDGYELAKLVLQTDTEGIGRFTRPITDLARKIIKTVEGK